MRLGTLVSLTVAVSLAFALQADAQGSQNKCTVETMGKVFACSFHGQPGEQICEEPGTFSPCQPTPPTDTGTVFGKYLILTVIYAPPGTNNGKTDQGDSQVSYESDSTTGTTTTNSNSFKQGNAVSASVKCTDCDLGIISGGGGFEYSKSTTRTDALAVTKKTTSTIQVSGPAADGIDHGHDQIWLFLHPKFDVTVSGVVGSPTKKTITWTLDPNQSAGLIQYLYVDYLRDPSRIPPGILQDLQAAGITPADYPVILGADPLAQCLSPVAAAHAMAPAIKPAAAHATVIGKGPIPIVNNCQAPLPGAPRYVRANMNLPYDPPLTANDPVPLQPVSIDNSSADTETVATEYDHKESATISGGFTLGVYETTLTDTKTWEWTDTNSIATTTGNEQKMSMTLGGPAFGYTGPNNMDVYIDTIYNTFAFVPNELSAQALHGVVSSGGKPVGGRLVTATAGRVKYRTFTNAHGKYRFSAQLKGPVVVQAGTASRKVPNATATQSVDFR